MKNFIQKYYLKIIPLVAGVLLTPIVFAVIIGLLGFLLPVVKNMQMYQYLTFAFVVLFWGFIDSGEIIFYAYLITTPICSILTLISLLRFKKRNVFTYFPFYYFLVGLIIYSLIFWNIIKTFGNYFPATTPKPHVKYYIIGYPQNLLSSYYKRMHIFFEGSSIRYAIMGWQDNNTLIYEQWNRIFGQKVVMQFDVRNGKSSRSNILNKKIIKKTCESKECLVGLIVENPNALTGCLVAYVSPNERRLACLSQHLYGPEDIIIFEK